MSKIIIFGFPHCGTSILKSIIGHIDDIEEIIDETYIIEKKTTKKYILCKFPFTYDEFFSEQYNDYIKIFILRNPLYVFSSLNKRFSYQIPIDHDMDVYINTITKFINYKNNSIKNLYTIIYEDLFYNNFQNIKKIFDSIGLNYTDKIFKNEEYYNKIISNVNLLEYKPKNTQHSEYRTWQINEPFVNNNDINKLDLSEKQKEILLHDEKILTIYPNIGDIF